MKHFLQRKSAFGSDKGGWRRFGVALYSILVATTLSGCTQTKTPKNRAEGRATPDSDGTNEELDGTERQSDAASQEQQNTGPNDSPPREKSTSQDNGDSAGLSSREPVSNAPISKILPDAFNCSGFNCYRFSKSREALVPIILHHKARLIAFGEAHAPASFLGATTVHRFTQDLLPTIADGASYLLLELLNPPKEGCQKEKAAAQEESEKVTEGQSEQNQNEYLTLGTESRKLGVVPDILWPTCEDLAFIASPEGGVVAMMETIAKLSEKSLKEQLRAARKGRPLVLAYGGALHNDALPREGRESWSYGPEMLEDTRGSYLEIDLIVPELISDSDSWKSFAWYDAYQALDHNDGAILMKWGEKSYSLFLEPGR